MTNSLIMEIRAGAGGEEAALFARDLFNMYFKYSAAQNWNFQILDSSSTALGGMKNITFKIKGEEVFNKLKYEGGVHRVQRIPKTEKGNRVHTSTVSVAVLPSPKPEELKINPSDLKMDFFKSSGPGGQNVNKRQTAVRITHLPSNIVVSSQTNRNLEQNKRSALSILEAKIFSIKERQKKEELKKERTSQIGQAQRAEKIRTYNFPQDRLTDHRAKKKWHNLEKIMSGDLEPVVSKLQKSLS